MVLRGIFAAAILVAVLATPSCAASTAGDPAQVTSGFYDAYKSIRRGGVPEAGDRAKLSPFISPALDKLLADADAGEKRYNIATKNEVPPLFEGDPFTSMFEGATSFVVGTCTSDAKVAHCPVAFTYDDKNGAPSKWTDSVDLVQTDKGWKVDDVVYGGTWDFGNKGKLSDTLKSVIAESLKPVQ